MYGAPVFLRRRGVKRTKIAVHLVLLAGLRQRVLRVVFRVTEINPLYREGLG